MKWISVEDELPGKPGWYRVKTCHAEAQIPFVHNGAGELVWVCIYPISITHWMRLPEPPITKDNLPG